MKTIPCRRCGARIEPSAVKCPACGAIQKQNFAKKKTPAKKPKPAAVFAVGAVALLAVVTVILCFMGGVFDFGDKVKDTMPDVVGLTEESARQMLEGLGLRVEVTTVESEETAGFVLEQSIKEGTTLKGNQAVKLTVSLGSGADLDPEEAPEGDEFKAPHVVGEEFGAAQMRTESWGLNLFIGKQVYSQEPAGTILAQDPEGGSIMQRGQAVEVTVSLGPEDSHIITATAGKGGSISPMGRVTVENGETTLFEIIPDEGYVLEELTVDGETVENTYDYVFTDVTTDHSLYASFRAAQPGEEVPEREEKPAEKPSTPSDVVSTPSDVTE